MAEKALHHRGGLEDALAAPAMDALPPRDRGFARALAMTALRRKGGVDRILQARLAKPPPEEVQTLIGLGLVQLLYLETPAHAAVSTTMALADASAAIPARLLDVKPGETALDLCAAPGGKTMQLAAAGGAVTALDRSALRLQRVNENLARIGLTAEIVAADAGAWDDSRQFEAVLLDAPCTATGTFRRHPDVLWATRPGDIAKLAQAQRRLLDAAARHVRPGGRLVYCVCSLEPEEGEGQIEAFLGSHPEFALSPITPGEGGSAEASLTGAGTLRILPCHREGGTDGFFAARFVRQGPDLAGTRAGG